MLAIDITTTTTTTTTTTDFSQKLP